MDARKDTTQVWQTAAYPGRPDDGSQRKLSRLRCCSDSNENVNGSAFFFHLMSKKNSRRIRLSQ
jgi:hypothetical protein